MKYCSTCGRQMGENDVFCPYCGNPRGGENLSRESRFDGSFWPYFGWRLLAGLIRIFTLNICYPFAMVMVRRYECEHTIINGKRLKFTGSGGAYMGWWMLWWLLGTVTLGIFYLWLPIKNWKWMAKYTHFEDFDEEKYNATHSEDQPASYWEGGEFAYVGWSILSYLVTAFTLGICRPFGFEWLNKIQYNGMVVDGKQLQFKEGSGGSFVGTYFVWTLISSVTCGIYGLWIPFGVQRWETENVSISRTVAVIDDGPAPHPEPSPEPEPKPNPSTISNPEPCGNMRSNNISMPLPEVDPNERTVVINQTPPQPEPAPAPVLAHGNILCCFGAQAGYEFPIYENEEIIIGRSPEYASIIVDNQYKYVSRKHCGIRYDGETGRYLVMDYSKTGTKINENRITKGIFIQANPGDVLRLDEKVCYRLK